MEGITDLLSTIVFFLAWLFPILFIISARRRSSVRREKQSEETKKPPAAARPPRYSDEGPGDFISRLMEIQGISSDEVETADAHRRSLHILEENEEEEVQQLSRTYTPASYRETAVKPIRKKPVRRVNPLVKIERYPLKRRAVILSEIIGKPKALTEYEQ